jgi:hypothetical protein
MKQTKAAAWWLAVARTALTTEPYLELMNTAQKIARERGASQLGKNHCEMALMRMGGRAGGKG